jgi:molybdate transport system regulatory protein
MKISARNAFKGKIVAIRLGAINAEVDLSIPGGDMLVAMVTNESVKSLGLAVGGEATALIKASSALVMTGGEDMKLSARNRLSGTVTKVSEAPVSAAVSIALKGGGEFHATITRDSAIELGLKPGVPATAVFKAAAVILAVPA